MSTSEIDAPSAPPRALSLHPVFLSALGVLIVNDHLLKQTFGNWWTGKISDAAWLVLCPLFLAAVYEHLTRRAATIGIYAVASILVTGALIGINLVPFAGDLYQVGLAGAQWPFKATAALLTGNEIPAAGRVQLARDPTDLATLPFVLVAFAVGVTHQRAVIAYSARDLSGMT